MVDSVSDNLCIFLYFYMFKNVTLILSMYLSLSVHVKNKLYSSSTRLYCGHKISMINNVFVGYMYMLCHLT